MFKSLIYLIFSGVVCAGFVFGYIPTPPNGSSYFGAFLSGGIFGVSLLLFCEKIVEFLKK